jgi:hypothetical protein
MRKALWVVRQTVARVRAGAGLLDWKLLGAGVACLLAAIFPEPVELPGLTTLPTLKSTPQRVVAGIVGLGLIILSVVVGTGGEGADTSDQPGDRKAPIPDVRGRMLLRVRRFWLDDVLSHALAGTGRLELRMRRRDVVERPLDVGRAVPEQPEQGSQLPVGSFVHEVFEQLDQALLILGPPGGGKTTLLLELLAELLDGASRDDRKPVPMVFNLSSWRPGTPIVRWLGQELHRRYGLPSRIARAWIDGDQVFPLLDGLDEVAAAARAGCVRAINEFHDEHGLVGVVVCCRTDDYLALGIRLRLNGAVELDELDGRQVASHLRSAGRPLSGVRAVLQDDPVLAELLRSPLMLSLVTSAYRDRSPRQIRSNADAPRRRDDIIDSYVDAMLARRSPHLRRTTGRLMAWLSWLAKAMLEHGQSVFQLEWMQPDLLSRRWQRWLVTSAPGVVAVLLVLVLLVLPPLGVLGPPPLSLDAIKPDYLGSTVLFLAPVLLVSFDRRIRPWDMLAWSRQSLRRRFWPSFAWGLALALAFYAALALAMGLFSGGSTLVAVRVVASVTLLVGTSIWLVTALEGKLADHYDRPNQGIRTSARNALGLGLPLIVLGVLGAQAGNGAGLAVWAPFLTLAGLVVGLRVGGRAVVQHATLRALLAANGSAPLRYVTALDTAVDLVLMRRVGGSFVFLHRLLLEHLAGHAAPTARSSGPTDAASPPERQVLQ